MEELKEFSPEVCEELKYYVYRLIDPRNGQTFYVGKGKNNRLFAHAKCTLKDYEKKDVDYSKDDDDEENLKYKTIRQIKESGLDVIYIIEKYGLEERDALVIESVLIDTYRVERKLTNKVRGFNSTDSKNAITIERDLSVKEYVDSITNPKYIIIKVKDYWLSQCESRYECTRSAWKINCEKVKNYPYVLSVTGGIVREVFKVNEWHPCRNRSGRFEFTGEIAKPEISNIFIGKKIPSKYRQKGNANPVLYGDPNGN